MPVDVTSQVERMATSALSMPGIIAARADGISGGLQPIHIAVKLVPDDSLHDGWMRQPSLSPLFSPLVLSTRQHSQSHDGWLFLCCSVTSIGIAILASGLKGSLLPSTVLSAHGFCFCGSRCSLILQKAGGNVTSDVGNLSAKPGTGFRKHLSFPVSIFAPQSTWWH